MSHKPGIRYLPVASITCAPCGTLILLPLPSAIRCSSSITTVIPDLARPLVTLITVTCVKTSGSDGEVVIVFANSNPGKRRIKRSASIFLISFLAAVNEKMSNVALQRRAIPLNFRFTLNNNHSQPSPLQAFVGCCTSQIEHLHPFCLAHAIIQLLH